MTISERTSELVLFSRKLTNPDILLEYGCLAFNRMAEVHMIKLERIQYRCLRIALGLMLSTHVQAVEVIAGVEPLRL
jgi:hypothetical protein